MARRPSGRVVRPRASSSVGRGRPAWPARSRRRWRCARRRDRGSCTRSRASTSVMSTAPTGTKPAAQCLGQHDHVGLDARSGARPGTSPVRSSPVCTSSSDEERAVPPAQRLRRLEILRGGTRMPASAWIGSTHDRRVPLRRQRAPERSTSPNGTGVGGRQAAVRSRRSRTALSISDSAPHVSPWKAPARERMPARPRVGARELDHGLDALAPRAREEHLA